MRKSIWLSAILLFPGFFPFLPVQAQPENKLYVYNWFDYIAPDTNAHFTKKTHINVIYNTFDSNEVLESKLLSGSSGYDVVVPSHDFFAVQLMANVYAPLDKRKIPNLKYLDKSQMQLLSRFIDPRNKYGVPYTWGTTGIAYNEEKIRKILGPQAPVDSWALLFEPKYMKKLHDADCEVGFIDAPTEVFASVLKYMHPEKEYDPNRANVRDFDDARDVLLKVRPYISYFSSDRIVTDLTKGNICMALVWSGDVMQAQYRAKESKSKVQIKYSIPKEGAGTWFDILAVPRDAPHKSKAMAYINFILDPKVNASIVNYTGYATANVAAQKYVNKSLLNNPAVYASKEVQKRLFLFKPLTSKVRHEINRNWVMVKSG